jgi:ABC-type sugar transport system ATPase subunit
VLEIRGLRKNYGETRALNGLDLVVPRGEVFGIAGPNGAGKSTLMRLLAGEEVPTAGGIFLDGTPWSARAGRVAVVHQEPQLFPNLSVVENLLVGREHTRLGRPGPSKQELAILSELEILQHGAKRLRACSLAVQQRTEIARAIARDAQLFLFDEPNSALTEEESDHLFARMRALASEGRIVIFVSHRLRELVSVAHRVAVIRDGRCTALIEGESLTQDALARELVVEEDAGNGARTRSMTATSESGPLLRVTDWVHPRRLFRVPEFGIRPGEIVAIIGVEGSGAREFVASLAGHQPALGSLVLAADGGRRGGRALAAFIPASRTSSLFPNFSVAENVVSRLGPGEIAYSSRYLRKRRIFQIAEAARRRFQIRCASVRQPIRSLSGGNQQKVAIAAAMLKRPVLLVAEEPTRGVDVSSKAEIYHLLRQFADDGKGVVMYCTEIPEVFEIADRAFVMDAGRVSHPLDISAYASVQELAGEVARLERHSRDVGEASGGSVQLSDSDEAGARLAPTQNS